MKYTYLALVLLLLLTACNNKTKTVNGKPFSIEQTTALLTDIQVFESLINTHTFFQDKEEQKMIFQEILERHKFTQDDLDSTLTYLENNLILYQEILDSVKINVEKMKKIDLPYLKTMPTFKKATNKPNLPVKKRR